MRQYLNARRFFHLFWLIVATIVICGCAVTPEQKYAKFFERGTAQLKKHDYARAILEFRTAIQVKPKSAEAYYQLAGFRRLQRFPKCPLLPTENVGTGSET